MKIAEYFAEFSIRPDRNSIRRVDSELKKLENKLRGFGKNSTIKLKLSGFNVDQPALRLALGNSLDIASKSVAFEISKFVVNDRNLQAALLRAARRLPPLPPGPNPPPLPPRPGPYPPDSRRGSGAASGFIGGGVARLYSPALALAFGGYGLAKLNKRNQEVVAAQLQTQAVLSGNAQQLGITPEQATEQGKESFQFLRKTANRVGFNYLDASGDYNILTSNLLGSGGTVAQAQNIFKGFAEYGRVNKLSPARQKLVFNALSQIAGKDKLQAEELTKQLGNSLPGAKDIFAQAYQKQIGGNLTGSKAIIALEAAMKKGLVRGNILNPAAAIASQKSQAGLEKASEASQAEQQRYQNSVNDLAVVASDAGIEEGFARIFRTLAVGLDESNGLVRILAEGFNDATKWADDLLLWPQSFVRALEGRDSLVADWLGKDDTEQLRADWKDIKQIFTDISALKFDFLPTLKATSAEIASILNGIAAIQRFRSGDLPTETKKFGDIEKIDPFGTGEYTSPKGIFDAGLNNFGVNLSNAKIRGKAVYEDPSSPFYQKPELFDANKEFNIDYYRNLSTIQKDPNGQGIGDAVRTAEEVDVLTYELKDSLERRPESLSLFSLDNRDPIESSLGLNRDNIQTPADIASQNRDAAIAQADQSSVVNNVTNQFDITISVDATLAGIEIEQQAQAMAQAFSTSLTGAFEQVQVNFPQK